MHAQTEHCQALHVHCDLLQLRMRSFDCISWDQIQLLLTTCCVRHHGAPWHKSSTQTLIFDSKGYLKYYLVALD